MNTGLKELRLSPIKQARLGNQEKKKSGSFKSKLLRMFPQQNLTDSMP